MLMESKKGLVMGVANERSIAWGIAKSIAKEGGELAFTYQGEALKKRVIPLAESLDSKILIPCDVTDSLSMKKTFDEHNDISGVIHFAAFKSVPESVEKPLSYYHNNINGLLNVLLGAMSC